MEARDSGSKIRPLPIDDLDSDTRQPAVATRRRVAPLLVIFAGALAFAVITQGLSVDGDSQDDVAVAAPASSATDDPVPASSTTVPPAPPVLSELLPVAAAGIDLVGISASAAQLGHWASSAATPTYSGNVSQPLSAAYNADGTRVAISSAVRDGSLIIDSPQGGSPTYIGGGISGSAWHPTDPDLLAWAETSIANGANETIIRVGDVSGHPTSSIEPLVEFRISEANHALRAWGDWGFATTASNSILGFDQDGNRTRAATGTYFDSTDDGTLLAALIDDQGAVPFLLRPDGAELALPSLDIGASDFAITGEGDWLFAITFQEDGHTSILARAVQSRSTRLTSIEQTARLIGTAQNDRVLVLQEVHTNDLLFKDWSTGAEFRVPSDRAVSAVHLPDGAD